MYIEIDNLILGGGYAGLLQQQLLNDQCEPSIILERGYNNQYQDKDYVIVFKKEAPYTGEPIDVIKQELSSPAAPFAEDYTVKVFGRKIDWANALMHGKSVRYLLDPDKLTDIKMYGNVEVTNIDLNRHRVYGKVLNMNKTVEVKYNTLYSTLPINRFSKLLKFDFLTEFNIFMSFFPIGIKKVFTEMHSSDMRITYYSDPQIPFYRTQHYGNTVFYEYCLNKPMNIRFNRIVTPGKFVKPEQDKLDRMYAQFKDFDVHLVGRFARWDPDYVLDNIYYPENEE